MPLASTTVIRLTNFPPTLPNVPPNYPIGRAPGKIALLLNANDNYLYHRFSPFTNYHDSLLSPILSNKQPFIYTFIDEKNDGVINKLPKTVKGLVNVIGINQGSLNDVVRVSKFLISSWGVQFLITQTAIQRLAPFDETRIYNPLSPILATVQPLTAGIGSPPTRHIEGGLLGLANSITSTVGINIQSGFNTPSSTAGDKALPTPNLGQGKGLIRGQTATAGSARVNQKWVQATSTPTGFGGLISMVKDAATSFFGTTKPKQPSGTIYRADENTSFRMAVSSMPALRVSKRDTGTDVVPQMWYPKGLESAGLSLPYFRSKMFNFGDVKGFQYVDADIGLQNTPKINGNDTGYDIQSDTQNFKYSSNVKKAPDGTYTNSDMLVQYSYYAKDAKNFPTTFADAERATKLKDNLQKVINKINSTTTYNAFKSPASYLLPSAGVDADYVEYDNWSNKQQDKAKPIGVVGDYQDNAGKPKTIDVFVSKNNNLRMATSFMSDGINTLGVLPKNRSITETTTYPGWTEWKPYEDDLIAFFFYDVVNEKYVPFRATVKAISEGNTAFWDELRFIGRADQLYSYNGFSRTLSFTFNVVINSVSELLPSWKKINYLASSVKPSNYTSTQDVLKKNYNRFIVPPMFMLTIGDLYKFQPIVITSLNVNIPDDAAWETLNEENSKDGWSYLNGLVTAPNLGKNYGQLPREVEIAVTCNLLEKERAVVGGSHFGHQPRIDDWENVDNSSDRFLTSGSADIPYLPTPSILHQQFVVWNKPGTPNPGTPSSTTTAQRANSANTIQLP